jgi:hypothetical protein
MKVCAHRFREVKSASRVKSVSLVAPDVDGELEPVPTSGGGRKTDGLLLDGDVQPAEVRH